MKKQRLIIILLLVLLASVCAVFYFTRPKVIFLYSSLLNDDYFSSLSKPKRVSFFYRTEYVSDDKEVGKCDLIIVLPPSSVDNPNAIYIKRGNERLFSFSDVDLFSKALYGDGKERAAILYNSEDAGERELAKSLEERSENLSLIEYSGRISAVNIDSIEKEIEDLKIVRLIVPEPLSALKLIERSDIKIYLSFLDAAAFKGIKNVISISPDWDKAIRDALKSDGDVAFSFALSST